MRGHFTVGMKNYKAEQTLLIRPLEFDPEPVNLQFSIECGMTDGNGS